MRNCKANCVDVIALAIVGDLADNGKMGKNGNRDNKGQFHSNEGALMAAHTQALTVQVAAFLFLSGLLDMGRTDYGLLAACLLFWATFFLLFLCHRGHVTKFDLFFLRWGSLPFVLVGLLILPRYVKSCMQALGIPL
jgi:hypothetical protein